jgi:hypothetical protein
MSTLAMILTAAMMVPASGPEAVSGEIGQALDLSGEWEGNLAQSRDDVHTIRLDVTEREAFVCDLQFETWCGWKTKAIFTLKDEGRGRLRIESPGEVSVLGIYKQHGDRIVICCASLGLISGEGGKIAGRSVRPVSFRPGDGRYCLTIHRVKPRK